MAGDSKTTSDDERGSVAGAAAGGVEGSPAGLSRRALLTSLAAGATGGGLLGAVNRGAMAAGSRSRRHIRLRPPGARDEPAFLAACLRCGQCIDACPYKTLRLAGPREGAARSMGTPFFLAEEVPCELCAGYDELLCIAACPTNALEPVDGLRTIRIGTAVLLEETCLAFNGVMCRSCWHACPFPNEAIRFDARLRPEVVEEACIGCGLCTRACPTTPRAIPVRPRGGELDCDAHRDTDAEVDEEEER